MKIANGEHGMRLSIVVPWRDRDELRDVVPSLSKITSRYGGDLTIVNYGGDGHLLRSLLYEVGSRVTLVTVRNQRWFNKSRALNIGAAHTVHDLIFFCDCDIILSESALDELLSQVGSNPGAFGTLSGVKETELNSRNAGNVVMFGYTLKLRLANGKRLEIEDNEEDAENGMRRAPGLLMVHRVNFQKVEGYNGRLHGWGWEDQDMIARLTLGGGLVRLQSGWGYHISHDDAARIRFYPPVKDRWESRDRMFRDAMLSYDRGDFTGTLTADIADLTPFCTVEEVTP